MAEPKNNDIGRMLPHNDDAEKAILGALLLSWRLSSIVLMVVAGTVSLALLLRKERVGK